MAIVIRPLRLEDRKVWEDLLDAYAAFYKTTTTVAGKAAVWDWIFGAESPEAKNPEADNSEADNSEADNSGTKNSGAEDFWADLALLDGKVVGLCQYQLMHRSLSGAKVVYLSDLYVRPEQRGGGVGRAMIDHVIGFAKARRIGNVRWLTQEFNYAGRRLYDTYRPKSDFILYSIPVDD